MSLRRSAAVAAFLSITAAAPVASAQLGAGVGPAQGSGPASATGMPSVENDPESGEEPKLSPRSYKLFDTRRGTNSYELRLGPIYAREIGGHAPNGNDYQRETGEISVGSVVTTPQSPFFLSGSGRTLLRVFDSKSLFWTLFLQEIATGIRLGPFEPEARFGVSMLTIDVVRGDWSVELFSPRVAAGVAIHAGKFRLDIEAHSEYLWRWFGPDYLIRGVTMGLRIDLPRPKSPFPKN